MTAAPEPTSGSLSARIIRACPVHTQCPLECPERTFEDLGEIASFDNSRGIRKKLMEGYYKWRASSQP